MRVLALFIYPIVAAVLIFALTTPLPKRVKYNGGEKLMMIKPDSVQVRNSAVLGGNEFPATNITDNNPATGWIPGYNVDNPDIYQNEVKFVFKNGTVIEKILFSSGNNSYLPSANGQNYLKAKSLDVYVDGQKYETAEIYESEDESHIGLPNSTVVKTISLKPKTFYWGRGRQHYLVTEVKFLKTIPVDYDTVKLPLDQVIR